MSILGRARVCSQPEERINDAYFPLGAIFSVVAEMKDSGMFEIGTIGRGGHERGSAAHGQRNKRDCCGQPHI